MLSDQEVYEDGTINGNIHIQVTGVGFWSPGTDNKIALTFEPRSSKLQLLPKIDTSDPSFQRLIWDNYAAVYCDTDVDSNLWTSLTYMGTMGGSVFTHILSYAKQYGRTHHYYLPFSIYDHYPGTNYVPAYSSDEFVWGIFEEMSQLVTEQLHPMIVPKKLKFMFFAQQQPQLVDTAMVPQANKLVLDHFMAVKRCLHTRNLERLSTLMEFTTYYSRCLEDIAYIFKDQNQYYRIYLSTNIAGDIKESEGMPVKESSRSGYTWFDIVLIMLFGFGTLGGTYLGMRKTGVIEHIRMLPKKEKKRPKLVYNGIGGPIIEMTEPSPSPSGHLIEDLNFAGLYGNAKRTDNFRSVI